ncbi:MAG: hypothetical protein QOD75_2767 [Blastocatellia bacterium]|jgi:proteasome lid subunit RPN8/RPN11|nr:hypothetical protein [Blastocatellia bacterium]
MKNNYQYSLMLYRGGEASLGQVSVTVDWEPAREWTAFRALRQGLVAADEPLSQFNVQPLWHPRLGEPYVKGFRLNIDAPCSREASAEFSKSYFSEMAKQASGLLIKKGMLKKGEPFKYLVAAFPQTETVPARPKLNFTTEEVMPDLPLPDATLSDVVSGSFFQGDHNANDMHLFVPQRVLDEAKALSKEAGARETGGILIGHLNRDAGLPDLFGRVTAQIPARHTEATLTSLTFTSETWTEVRSALELRRKNEIMLGWWHSHPVREWCKDCSVASQKVCVMGGDFFSAHDHALHRTIFPRAYSIALVVNDLAGDAATFSMFGWRQGLLESRGFHVIEREQAVSVSARGLQLPAMPPDVRKVSDLPANRK